MSVDLAALQRGLANVLRGSAPPPGDAYVAEVAESQGIVVVREILRSWRELLLRRACPMTVVLLDQRDLFQDALSVFLTQGSPPSIDEMALVFLDISAESADPLLSAVAQFERAMIRTCHGDATDHIVVWPCDPTAAIELLFANECVDDLPKERVVTVVSGGTFRVV